MSNFQRCPFCGRTPTTRCIRQLNRRLYVRCAVCECRGPSAKERNSAIDLWNDRRHANEP